MTSHLFSLGGANIPLAKPDQIMPAGRKRFFITSALVSVLALAMTEGAMGQVLPPDCISDGLDPIQAQADDTVTCVAAAPTIINPITTNVADLTIVVGDDATPTTVENVAGDGINVSGNGAQSITVVNNGSRISGSTNGVDIIVTGGVGDLTLVSEGTIAGGDNGIRTQNFGSGNTSLIVNNVTGATGDGIHAVNGSTADNLTIVANGDVSGGDDGIDVINNGTGALSITASGNVSSTSAASPYNNGISAQNYGTDLTIVTTGTVTGGDGIDARNLGSGALNISTGAVTGLTNAGIAALNRGTDISVNASGPVIGVTQGIYAGNTMGSGNISITTADVTSEQEAIFANTYGDVNIDSRAGTVSISGRGRASYGAITAQAEGAINVVTADVNSGAESRHGLQVFNGSRRFYYGTYGGIYFRHYYGTSTHIDTSAGAVSGAKAVAIGVNHIGTEGLSITTADVGATETGRSYYGIRALATGSGAISVDTSAGTAQGSVSGISVSSDGNVDSFEGADISVMTADVVSDFFGISVNALGNGGDVSITTANVSGINEAGTRGYGIYLNNRDGHNEINTLGGTVSGGAIGIDIKSRYGDVELTTSHVNGMANDGIRVQAGGVVNIDSRAGEVQGGEIGIHVLGGVSSYYGGFYSDVEHVTVRAANVTGGETGIDVHVEGTGDLTLISEGTVIGGDNGVRARNYGTGSTSLTVNNVTGTTGDGVNAVNGTAAVDLTIIANGDVSGGDDGIDVINNGTGALSITASGNVSSTNAASPDNTGITAQNYGTDLTIVTTGTVTGGDGIYARNHGSGDLNISTGAVNGETGLGVLAVNYGPGNISIATTDVTANEIAVYARTDYGDASVDTRNGTISISGSGDAYSGAITVRGVGAVNVTTADVNGGTGSRHGVQVINGTYRENDGYVSGTSTHVDTSAGTVRGSWFSGVRVNHYATGDLTITTANVGETENGRSEYGIQAIQTGSGTVTIDTTAGTVQGSSAGVLFVSQGDYFTREGADISVTTANVISDSIGISIYSRGQDGDVSITTENVSGIDETGMAGTGIYVNNQFGNNIINTTGGAISGGEFGIEVISRTGDVELTTAHVTGMANEGIRVRSGGNVNIDTRAGEVQGGEVGIHVVTGLSSPYALGFYSIAEHVTVSSTDVTGDETGILIAASSNGATLEILGSVSGGSQGIVTSTQTGTDLTVLAGGMVSGGDVAISTMAHNGSTTSNDTLNIMGQINGDIMTFQGNDEITLGVGAVVDGDILLGDGDDIFNFNGGFSRTAQGGDGVDTFNLNSPGFAFNNSGQMGDGIFGFEIANFNNGGYILTGLHTGLTSTNFNSGINVLNGVLESVDVIIASGATLGIGALGSLTGNVFNMGELSLNTGAASVFAIDGDFTQTANGELTFGRQTADGFDRMVTTGRVNLGGALTLNQDFYQEGNITLIDAGMALAGNFDTINGLASGLLISQSIEFDNTLFDVSLVTDFIDAATITGLNTNQSNLANNLMGQLNDGSVTGGLVPIGNALGLVGNVDDLASTIDELNTGPADIGIQVFQNTQFLFMESLLDPPRSDSSADGTVKTASLGEPHFAKSPLDGPQIWGSIQYEHVDQDRDSNTVGFDTDGFAITAGVTDIEAGNINLGVMAGFVDLTSETDGNGTDEIRTQIFRAGLQASAGLNANGSGVNAHIQSAISLSGGSNEIEQNIIAPALGLAVQQSADVETNAIDAIVRLRIDGQGGNEWKIKPHISAAWSNTHQDGFTLGAGMPTAIQVNKIDADRFTFGYGATFEQNWNNGGYIQLGASGYHHTGDTQTSLSSRFLSVAGTGSSFITNGNDIRNQYLVKGSTGMALGDSWLANAEIYGQFGDISGYGGRLKLVNTF